jgi:hypothetical protein
VCQHFHRRSMMHTSCTSSLAYHGLP